MYNVLMESFTLVNALPTFFLVLSLIYWLVAIVGIIDMDMIDFDVESPEVDADIDAEVDGEISISWLNNILVFFNLGKVPFMIVFSFFALAGWFQSVFVNFYLNPYDSPLLSLGYYLPIFISSLFIAKFCTIPFVSIFAKLADDEDNIKNATGKVCTVILPIKAGGIGQAEINENGTVLKINATANTDMSKGQKGLVIDFLKEKNQYTIEPYNQVMPEIL